MYGVRMGGGETQKELCRASPWSTQQHHGVLVQSSDFWTLHSLDHIRIFKEELVSVCFNRGPQGVLMRAI